MGWTGALVLVAAAVGGAEGLDPGELVDRLASVGPRSRSEAGYQVGQEVLMSAMDSVGLRDTSRMPSVGPEGWVHLTGKLPGTSEQRMVFSAHYDTAAGRGRLDNASGCAAIAATADSLSKLPRRNTCQWVFTDGEEELAVGSQAWLAELSPEIRRGVLANLNVDTVGIGRYSGPGVLHIEADASGDPRAVTPAWLVHAVIRGAQASGVRISVLDPRWSWWAQLAVRCARPGRVTDGRRFLEAGIPSVTFSDLPLTLARGYHAKLEEDVVNSQRLQSWVRLLTATARRLDDLEDRPIWESEYLVLRNRVWIRRDLVWLGFILWMVLVWRGLPGTWRQREPADRRRIGRSYLPGFAFRMIFLLAVFLIPTFATLLLYPSAVVALVGKARRPAARQFRCLLASLPALAFAGWLTVGQFAGWFFVDRAVLLPAGLVLLTLATFCSWQLGPSTVGEPGPMDAP